MTEVSNTGPAKCAHRDGDERICTANTIVVGQNLVFIENKLWAVENDPNNHGKGELIPSITWIKIEGIPIIVKDDHAKPDNLCPESGQQHCDPYAVGCSELVKVKI